MTRAPRYHEPAGAKLLFLSELVLICGCFYAAAALDWNQDPWLYFVYEGGWERLAFAAATILIALYFHHLYAEIRVRSRVFLLQQLCEVFGIALIAQSLLSYANPRWGLPHWLMLYGALFSLLAIFGWRLVYSRTVLNFIGRQRIVIVGRSPTVQDIAREIAEKPERGFEILGMVEENSAAALRELVKKNRPDRIVVGVENRRAGLPIQELLEFRYAGMTIEEAGTTYELLHRRVSTRDLNPRQLIFSRELSPAKNNLWIQRWLDRSAGLVLLLVSLPFLLVIAAALRLTSREPVLLYLPRTGKNGAPFTLLRFRRSPGLGALYRRLHLDAMPELLNVVRGEMSLVGPRPEEPQAVAEKSRSIPLYDYRHNVQPGMTGWAQINMSPEEQENDPLLTLEFDLYYIKHLSQTLNAYILVTTLKNRLVWADQP